MSYHNPTVPKFMTITEASEYFGVSKYQIRQWIKSNCIKFTFVGNRHIVEVESINDLLYSELKGKEKQ